MEEGAVEGTCPAGCCCLKDHSFQGICLIIKFYFRSRALDNLHENEEIKKMCN